VVDFDDLLADELPFFLAHVEHGGVDGKDVLIHPAARGQAAFPQYEFFVLPELDYVLVFCVEAREFHEDAVDD
jgi:hypothetical protein